MYFSVSFDNGTLAFSSGEFADVYKGTLKTEEGKGIVAVKVLRVSFFLFVSFFSLHFPNLGYLFLNLLKQWKE